MEVEVCYAERDRVWRVTVALAPGATIAEAIERSRIATSLTHDVDGLDVAVFGRRATRATLLVDGDRVELLRPLVVDPKEARRRRAAKKRHAKSAPSVTGSTAKPGPAAC